MKKAYINPTTEVVNVETAQMIAVSIDLENKNAEDAGMSNDDFDIWSLIEGGK